MLALKSRTSNPEVVGPRLAGAAVTEEAPRRAQTAATVFIATKFA